MPVTSRWKAQCFAVGAHVLPQARYCKVGVYQPFTSRIGNGACPMFQYHWWFLCYIDHNRKHSSVKRHPLGVVDGLDLVHVDVLRLGLDVLLAATSQAKSACFLTKPVKYSLESINGVHVIRRRDLETRRDVGQVNLALGFGGRAGSL